MTQTPFPDRQVDRDGGGRIVLAVVDGVGGLPHPESGRTELETARTPNLDRWAARASLGLHTPVAPGVTPGSGPGHLALFGYDPVEYLIGRGALSALGVGFDLLEGDVAIRLNLASLDGDGRITDRRAGRPSDEEGRRVVEKVRGAWRAPAGVQFFILHEKEHRAVLVLRGEGLGADVADTDPQETGVPPLPPEATDPRSARTAEVLADLLAQAREILRDEPAVHGFLARGFAAYEGYPSLRDRFGLDGVAVAKYPMYRGVARLVGMAVDGVPSDDASTVEVFRRHWDSGRYDYHFLHFKAPDARGEDRDFDAKVAAIESIDSALVGLDEAEPDVLVVTGDHSTPATMGTHSWHPVPVLIASDRSRPTATAFGESQCRGGDLGLVAGKDLMSLALAHAGRLSKYGA